MMTWANIFLKKKNPKDILKKYKKKIIVLMDYKTL